MKRSLIVSLLISIALVPLAAAKPGAIRSHVPALTLATRDGSVSLDSLRGKVVLVDFWASWCDPCRKSFPWMTSIYQRYADKGFAIVAINLDKTRDPAYAFLEKHPTPFVVAYDPDGKAAGAFKVAAMPTSFLIGRDGTILDARTGFDPRKTNDMESRIREACTR